MASRLEKVIREAITSNKYRAGYREVMKSVKGSKLIILSDSVANTLMETLESTAANSNVPVYRFKGTSLQLARLCGAPFRISTISIKTGNTDDITNIIQGME
jgi:large subunit ribosomal protein L30e